MMAGIGFFHLRLYLVHEVHVPIAQFRFGRVGIFEDSFRQAQKDSTRGPLHRSGGLEPHDVLC